MSESPRVGNRSDTETLASGAGIALIGRFIGRGLQVLTDVVLARTLGPAVFGLYAAGWAILRIVGLLAPLGLDKGVIRYGARYRTTDPARFRGVILESLGVVLATGLVVGVTIALGAGSLASFFGKPGLEPVFRGLAPAIGLIAGLRVGAAITRISKRIRPSVISEDLVRPSIHLGLVAVSYSAGWGLGGAVVACSVSFAVAFVIAVLQIRSMYGEAFAPGLTRRSVGRSMIPFSLTVSVSGASILLIAWVDRILLTALRPSADLGIYQAVAQPAFVFSTILLSFNAILVPMIAELAETGERERMAELYRVSTKWGLYVGTPLFLVICFAPDVLIDVVLGPDYRAGVTSMLILSVGQLVNAGTGAVGPLLIMTGHQRRWLLFAAGMLIVDVVLGLQWIPRWGMAGAAAATAFSITGLFTIGIWQIRRIHGFWPYDRRYVKGIVAAACTAAALWGLGRFDLGGGLAELLVFGLASVAVFAGILAILGLDAEDRLLMSVLKARAARVSRS